MRLDSVRARVGARTHRLQRRLGFPQRGVKRVQRGRGPRPLGRKRGLGPLMLRLMRVRVPLLLLCGPLLLGCKRGRGPLLLGRKRGCGLLSRLLSLLLLGRKRGSSLSESR